MIGAEPARMRDCAGCGIPQSDGYSEDCPTCQERRSQRIRKGEIYTPTGYAGELIDNRTKRGTLVAGVA